MFEIEPNKRYNWLMTYNWQQPDWPYFTYDLAGVQDSLYQFAEKTGRVSGVLLGLPDELKNEVLIDLIVQEASETSAIEGELISREDIRSSICNQLGFNHEPEKVLDPRAHDIASLMLDMQKTFHEPLSQQKLFAWHTMLFKHSADIKRMTVGQWRIHVEPMQIISGPVGKVKIHFEAPPSSQVPEEMKHFLQWFNETAPHKNKTISTPLVRAAIAHLYFESIHPFEDGNGRIGRAIAEKALSQGLGYCVLMSLSQTIEKNKKNYYEALKEAQSNNHITAWIEYFVETALAAQINAEQQINFILLKAKFFDKFKPQLSERQLKVVQRMFKAGPQGFIGGMNATKYISLTGVSKATATRDLQYLLSIGVLKQEGGGRSTHYQLNLV